MAPKDSDYTAHDLAVRMRMCMTMAHVIIKSSPVGTLVNPQELRGAERLLSDYGEHYAILTGGP